MMGRRRRACIDCGIQTNPGRTSIWTLLTPTKERIASISWFILISAVLMFVFHAVWSTSTFQQCMAEEEHGESYQQFREQPSGLVRVLSVRLAYAYSDLLCTGEVLHKRGEAVTAVASIAIALFTLTLKLSTDKLWKATNNALDVARREFIATHRPQLKVGAVSWDEPIDSSPPAQDPIVVRFDVVNVGQSTARMISRYAGVIFTYPPRSRRSTGLRKRHFV